MLTKLGFSYVNIGRFQLCRGLRSGFIKRTSVVNTSDHYRSVLYFKQAALLEALEGVSLFEQAILEDEGVGQCGTAVKDEYERELAVERQNAKGVDPLTQEPVNELERREKW